MAWHAKQAMQENLKDFVMGTNLKSKYYGTVISLEANDNVLELLNKFSWKTAIQKCCVLLNRYWRTSPTPDS